MCKWTIYKESTQQASLLFSRLIHMQAWETGKRGEAEKGRKGKGREREARGKRIVSNKRRR